MDSAGKIVRCFQLAAKENGVAVPSDDAVRNIIGLALNEALASLLPDVNLTKRAAVAQRYREHFLYLDETEMELFPGVVEGLEQLKRAGYQFAIATGKARRGLDRVLLESTIAHHFLTTRCADESFSKPHPQMLHDILLCTGVERERAVMVGDTTYDLLMARAANVDGIAVTYGAHERERLAAQTPRACCDSFAEVCAWLQTSN